LKRRHPGSFTLKVATKYMLLFWDGEGKPVYSLFPTKSGIIFYCTFATN
jgi:hypothetical protein